MHACLEMCRTGPAVMHSPIPMMDLHLRMHEALHRVGGSLAVLDPLKHCRGQSLMMSHLFVSILVILFLFCRSNRLPTASGIPLIQRSWWGPFSKSKSVSDLISRGYASVGVYQVSSLCIENFAECIPGNKIKQYPVPHPILGPRVYRPSFQVLERYQGGSQGPSQLFQSYTRCVIPC